MASVMLRLMQEDVGGMARTNPSMASRGMRSGAADHIEGQSEGLVLERCPPRDRRRWNRSRRPSGTSLQLRWTIAYVLAKPRLDPGGGRTRTTGSSGTTASNELSR